MLRLKAANQGIAAVLRVRYALEAAIIAEPRPPHEAGSCHEPAHRKPRSAVAQAMDSLLAGTRTARARGLVRRTGRFGRVGIPVLFRHDLGLIRIRDVGGRHDLHAILVENILNV